MATLQAWLASAIVLISLTILTLVRSESCLDRTYNRAESGPILSETTIPPLPSGCNSPSGLTCDWYPDCLNRCFYNCDQQTIDSAQSYCSKFSTNLWYFTQTGIRWVFSVRKCQQSMLAGQLAMDPIPSCDKISERVLQSHTDCFADPNPQANSGDSICGLQCQDFLAIFKTVEDETKMNFEETLMSAFGEADGQCAPQGAAANFHQCFNQNSGGYFRLVRFVLAEKENNIARDKRSTECDDKCVSEKVTNYLLSEKLGYAKNTTLDWSTLVKWLPSTNIEISILFMDSIFLTNANSSLDNVDMIASKTADLLKTDPNVKVDDTQYEVLEVSSCGDFLCSPGNSITVRLGPETTTVTSTSTSPPTTASAQGTAVKSTADSTQSSPARTEDSTTEQVNGGGAGGDNDGVISDKSVYDPENGATRATKWNIEFVFSALCAALILKFMLS